MLSQLPLSGQRWGRGSRRIRRREKQCLLMKGYVIFMYATNQFSFYLPHQHRQRKLLIGYFTSLVVWCYQLNYACSVLILLWLMYIWNFTFTLRQVSPSFSFSLCRDHGSGHRPRVRVAMIARLRPGARLATGITAVVKGYIWIRVISVGSR